MEKVKGTENPADHLTKGKAAWEFRDLLEAVEGRMEGRICEGRWKGVPGMSEGPDQGDWGGEEEDIGEICDERVVGREYMVARGGKWG